MRQKAPRPNAVGPKGVQNRGRSGGEEFVILLAHTNSSQACNVAERIRANIEAMNPEHQSQVVRVTASFGVAEWNGQETLDMLIQRADDALYRAKRLGRNRIEYA